MRLITLALVTAALISLAGRPWAPGYIALAAFIPLLFALDGERRKRRGALAGFIASLGPGIVAFEGVAPAEPWAYPLLVAVSGIWLALAGTTYTLIANRFGRYPALWSFPLLIVVAEFIPAQRWLFGHFANGMTAIGYTQFDTPLLSLAGWSGVSGVSLAVLLVNLALYLAWRDRRFVPAAILAACVAAATVIPVPGGNVPKEQNQPLNVAVIQGAVPSVDSLMARFDRAAAERMLEPYKELTALAGERGADLVVWGETVLPQPVRDGQVPAYVAAALEPASAALVGGVSFTQGQSANSAFYWEDGSLTEVYRKRALVPFNEPHYTAGTALPPLGLNGVALGIGICLDSVFGSLARDSVQRGAEVLVYITEDSFAVRTVTPELHLRVTAFRAVETGRYTVFTNQSGPSAVFNERGKVIERIAHGEVAGVIAEVPAYTGVTPFVRYGDWAGGLATLVSLAWLVACARFPALLARRPAPTH